MHNIILSDFAWLFAVFFVSEQQEKKERQNVNKDIYVVFYILSFTFISCFKAKCEYMRHKHDKLDYF